MSFALDIIFVARKLNYISSINISGKPHNKICMIKCNSLNFPQFNTENIKAKLESKVLMKDYVLCISLLQLCTTLLLHSAVTQPVQWCTCKAFIHSSELSGESFADYRFSIFRALMESLLISF